MALIKCKECGNEISSKAETCPKCGVRLKPGPGAKSGAGSIISLFTLTGGLVGAVVGLVIAVSLLSNKNSVTPTRQLEIRCEEGSKTQPEGTERRAFYESCMASGSSIIRSQERINREESQTFAKPIIVGGTESTFSPVAPSPPQDTVPSVLPTAASSTPPTVSEVLSTATSSTPRQTPEALPTATPSQSLQELEVGLINALRYDKKTLTRAGKSGDAIQAYMREGFVNKKPNGGEDYTGYYIVKKPAQFMGHDLVMIEEEKIGRYSVGCCVSPGAGVIVKINASTIDLEKFARDNSCSFSAQVNFQQKISAVGIKFKARPGEYASLSCRERDAGR